MKNIIQYFSNKLKQAEERISELKGRSFEIILPQEWKEKKLLKSVTTHTRTLSVETIVNYGSPIWDERERKESILETKWLKTYQTWNEKYIQIHEAQRIPNSLSLQWLQEITLWVNSLWSKTQAIFKATRKKKWATTCKTPS